METNNGINTNECSSALNRVKSRVDREEYTMTDDNSFIFNKEQLTQIVKHMSENTIEYIWITVGYQGDMPTIEMIPLKSAISLSPSDSVVSKETKLNLPTEWTIDKMPDGKYGDLKMNLVSYTNNNIKNEDVDPLFKENDNFYYSALDFPVEIDNSKIKGPGTLGAPAITSPKLKA